MAKRFINGDIQTNQAPPGVVQAFAGAEAPNGWLLCQGQVLSQAEYPALWTMIGDTFNTQTNPTTNTAYSAPGAGNFRIPDLRGVFVRGVGTASGLSAVSRGGFQDDFNKAHTHRQEVLTADNGDPVANEVFTRADVRKGAFGVLGFWESTGSGSTETRPRNVGLNYIIKV
jgi:phage-related tail fiber protein